MEYFELLGITIIVALYIVITSEPFNIPLN